MARITKNRYFHSYGVHDTFFIDIASDVGGYSDTFQLPNEGKVTSVDIRPTKATTLFSDQKIREMIVELHGIFSECHEGLKTTGKLDNNESLYLSQKYRSVLRSVANINDPNDLHMRDATLWAIYECMFLKTGDTPICIDLINWAHECFIFCHSIAKIATEEYENGVPIEGSNYWKAVVVSLLCCRFDECITFLRLLRNDSAARSFSQHLEQFDTEWLQDESKLKKFVTWQESLNSMILSKQFNSNRNILFLARLLKGDDDVLARSADVILKEWWHMMPFYVLIRYPTAPYNGLGPIAEECRAFFKKDNSEIEDLDPFFAVFNLGDISVLQELVANPWLSLHLVDTMFCCESYEKPILRIRNNLLESYGAALMANSNLWEIGASYLLQCGVPGKLRIEQLISSMLIEDEHTAEKLLKLCNDHDLDDARECVINTMTNIHLRKESWASAMTWALRLGHSKILDLAINSIVWKASEEDIRNLGVIEHLEEKLVMISRSLQFLLQYYSYFRALYTGDSQTSSKGLLRLVLAHDIPSNLHSVLFPQLACMLRESEIHIPRQTIYELLSFFKQYSSDHTDDDFDIGQLKQLLLIRLTDGVA